MRQVIWLFRRNKDQSQTCFEFIVNLIEDHCMSMLFLISSCFLSLEQGYLILRSDKLNVRILIGIS